MHTFRHFGLGIAILVATVLPLCAQQSPDQVQPRNPQTVVINFFVVTNPDTINQLTQIVDNQIRLGAKKIVILISSVGGETTSAFTAYNYLRGIARVLSSVTKKKEPELENMLLGQTILTPEQAKEWGLVQAI